MKSAINRKKSASKPQEVCTQSVRNLQTTRTDLQANRKQSQPIQLCQRQRADSNIGPKALTHPSSDLQLQKWRGAPWHVSITDLLLPNAYGCCGVHCPCTPKLPEGMTGEHKDRIAPAEARANQAAHRTLTVPKPQFSYNKCSVWNLGSAALEQKTDTGFQEPAPEAPQHWKI